MKRTMKATLALSLTGSLAGAGMLASLPLANAATVPNAITRVDVRETTANLWSTVHVDVDWALPNGTNPGDTWTLQNPEQLSTLDGQTFELTAPDGAVVANAVINGNTVTFTATDYVANNQNVRGTAFFTATRTKTVETGTPVPLSFTSEGQVFNDTITWTGDSTDPGTNNFYKWGKENEDLSTLQWGLLAARPAAGGDTIVFEDTLAEDAGFTFNCSPGNVTLYGQPNGLNGGGGQWVADNSKDPGFNGFTLDDCSPTHVKATLQVQNWQQDGTGVFWQPELRLTNVAITDRTKPRWDNNGTISYNEITIPVQSYVDNINAGGEGVGDQITIVKYTGDDAVAGDYDAAPGLQVAPGATTPIKMDITNTGSTNLTNVVIQDTNVSGPTITNLSCTFPGGPTINANAQNRVVFDPALSLAVNGVITCTGTLPALGAGVAHEDNATVTAQGNGPVTSEDPFHATSSATPSVRVGDYVWEDRNKDGLQDATDRPVAGATMTLTGPNGAAVTDVNGNAVQPVKTDAQGKYLFENLPVLPAGQHYTVTISDLPAGYVPTQAGVGDDRAVDSSTGSAESTDLTTDGAEDLTLDFGVIRPSVSVGDYVWEDTNKDGIQNDGEPGINEVTLTLTGPNGEAVTDVNGNPVQPVKTDADGRYSFENLPTLPAGQHYTVTITPPESYTATTPGAGDDRATDSSTGTAESVDLTTDGARDDTLDFGFVRTPVDTPKVSVGDYVFYDNNRDGIQNEGDTPVVGATLTLTGPDGKEVTNINGDAVAPIKTDDQGKYLFENLPVLPTGQHYTVTISDLPAGWEPTQAGVGDDRAVDSSTGSAESTDLTTDGAQDLTLDFGVVRTPVDTPKVSVGDYVFYDNNRDGIQNEGDTGVEGVTLKITGPDGGPVTDVNGKTVENTVTDAQGKYLFENLPVLPEGQHYTVTIVGTPEGFTDTWEATQAGAGDDRAVDSSTNSAESTDLTTNGAQDLTLDFGFVRKAATPEPTPTPTEPPTTEQPTPTPTETVTTPGPQTTVTTPGPQTTVTTPGPQTTITQEQPRTDETVESTTVQESTTEQQPISESSTESTPKQEKASEERNTISSGSQKAVSPWAVGSGLLVLMAAMGMSYGALRRRQH